MVKKKKEAIKKVEHSPTLRTIKMVENTLKNMDESRIKISELKKILPKKVNHNTLKQVIDYLEESNKIVTSHKGVTYIVNNSPKLKKAIENGMSYSEFLELLREAGIK